MEWPLAESQYLWGIHRRSDLFLRDRDTSGINSQVLWIGDGMRPGKSCFGFAEWVRYPFDSVDEMDSVDYSRQTLVIM